MAPDTSASASCGEAAVRGGGDAENDANGEQSRVNGGSGNKASALRTSASDVAENVSLTAIWAALLAVKSELLELQQWRDGPRESGSLAPVVELLERLMPRVDAMSEQLEETRGGTKEAILAVSSRVGKLETLAAAQFGAQSGRGAQGFACEIRS